MGPDVADAPERPDIVILTGTDAGNGTLVENVMQISLAVPGLVLLELILSEWKSANPRLYSGAASICEVMWITLHWHSDHARSDFDFR